MLLFIALTALVSSFVDQGFGLNVRSIAVFLGFLVGLIVVLASFKLPRSWPDDAGRASWASSGRCPGLS